MLVVLLQIMLCEAGRAASLVPPLCLGKLSHSYVYDGLKPNRKPAVPCCLTASARVEKNSSEREALLLLFLNFGANLVAERLQDLL